MSHDSFQQNLRLLCRECPSIAELCRQLEINRQQFNKYLAGTVFPSRRNLRKISRFFKINEADLLLPNSRFAEIVSLRDQPELSHPESLEAQVLSLLRDNSRQIPDRYLGYYFRYFYSFGYPGYITKSLVRMYRHGENVYWKDVEIFRRRDRSGRTRSIFKYVGLVSLIQDRFYIFEQEQILKSSITQTILYPSYTSGVGRLAGIQTSMSSLRGRQPSASTVMLEFLGASINIRRALRACGQFPEEDIDPDIRDQITNEIPSGSRVLVSKAEA